MGEPYYSMNEHSSNLIQFSGSAEDLTQILSSAHGLVVVEFTASWCPPCRRLDSVIRTLSPEYNKCLFVIVDTDEAKSLTTHFKISSIPHVKLYRGDKGSGVTELDSVTGFDVPQLKTKIQQHM